MTSIAEIWEKIEDFLSSGMIITIFNWSIPLYTIIALVLGIIGLILIFQLLKRLLYRLAKNSAFPAEIYNGLLFLFRLLFGILLIWLILKLLDIESDYLLVISGIVGTAIAFASVKTINNFIAGLWIALSTPYLYGDYVKIDNVEGLVVKITSFYTRIKTYRENTILIPNLSCINSNIVNYSINITSIRNKIEMLKKQIENLQKNKNKKLKSSNMLRIAQFQDEINEKELILKNIEDFRSNLMNRKTSVSLSSFVQVDKVIRYIFTLQLQKKLKYVEQKLRRLQEEWYHKYHFHVDVNLIDIRSHFIYEFTLTTLDPVDILKYYPDLVNDVYKTIYKKSN
ncbi:MAG: mechanosensitive ion channel domain-containing protein [Promethearchaeota archaeon]